MGRRQGERNERWLHLAARRAEQPFSPAAAGGDELYADPIWREVPALAEWKKMRPWRRQRACFSTELAEAVADDYFGRYWGALVSTGARADPGHACRH